VVKIQKLLIFFFQKTSRENKSEDTNDICNCFTREAFVQQELLEQSDGYCVKDQKEKIT
jgi:hypothetical protein